MKHNHITDMTKGWFVGDFSPSVARSTDCEVGIKSYAAGSYEAAHYHKVAIEITAVVTGTVRMFGREFSTGDIITIEPGEITDFEALTDAVTAVVKLPSVAGDKYLAAIEESRDGIKA
jgi:quercetin dioxygenase-like cupin family protein